jgi:hypothetical protein
MVLPLLRMPSIGDVDVTNSHNEDGMHDISAILCSKDQQLLKYIHMKLCGNEEKNISKEIMDFPQHDITLCWID